MTDTLKPEQRDPSSVDWERTQKRILLNSLCLRLDLLNNQRASEDTSGQILQPMFSFDDYCEVLRLARDQLRREILEPSNE